MRCLDGNGPLLVANLRHRVHAAAVQVRAEIPLFRPPLDRRHHLIADHQAADIAPFRFGNVFLHQNMSVQSAKGVDHALRRLAGLRQHHADPLGALHQLHHQRRAAHHGDQIAGVIRGVSDAGQWQIDALARQQLQRAQLIASAGNSDRFVQRIASQELKLAQGRGAIVGDRRANARDHRIKLRQLTPFVVDRRGHRADVHITGKRIEDLDLMTALLRCFAQAPT